MELVFHAPRGGGGDSFSVSWKSNNDSHFTDHGQYQSLIVVGQGRGILLDLGQKPNLFFRELAKHFTSLAVLGSVRAGKEIRQTDFHRFGNFRQCLKRRNGVAILDAREIAAQQAGTSLNIALRKPAVASVRPDDLAYIYFGFFFGHCIISNNRRYLTSYLCVCARVFLRPLVTDRAQSSAPAYQHAGSARLRLISCPKLNSRIILVVILVSPSCDAQCSLNHPRCYHAADADLVRRLLCDQIVNHYPFQWDYYDRCAGCILDWEPGLLSRGPIANDLPARLSAYMALSARSSNSWEVSPGL